MQRVWNIFVQVMRFLSLSFISIEVNGIEAKDATFGLAAVPLAPATQCNLSLRVF